MGVAYAEMVARQRIPSCHLMVLAAKRFLRMYAAAKSGKAGYYWCDSSAVEPCAFIERLPHVKGDLAGEMIVIEPWQMWVIIAIYGFRVISSNKRENGARLVRTVMLEVPRKNGKSLITAGLSLYELCVNANQGDDLFIIAPTERQAQKVMEPMREMVRFQPALSEHYGITRPSKEKLTVGATNSYAQVLTANGKHQDGHDPKTVMADEFHSVPPEIFKVMKSSQGARPESLFVQIGSAGYNTFGPGWDQRNEAIQVLEGERERDRLFAAIWTVDVEDMRNLDREIVIRKANPCYGVSLVEGAVAEEMLDLHGDPLKKAELMRTRFNIWGLGEQKLIRHDQWQDCLIPGIRLSNFEGDKCWVGVDLASRNDMCAWVAEFELDDRVVFFAKHYVPQDGPWRLDQDVCDMYEMWHEQGWLTYSPGSSHAYDEMTQDILDLKKKFSVQAVVIDDREANFLLAVCEKAGLPVAAWRKNASNFSEGTKDIVARAVGMHKGIAHDGNPVMAWNFDNVIGAYNTAELILPKKVSPHSNMRIDGFDAAVQAHSAYIEQIQNIRMSTPQPMALRGMRVVE